jgi:hypothetical protein
MKNLVFFVVCLISNVLFSQSDPDKTIFDTLGKYQSSTCLIIFDGEYTCTGTLLNNTSKNGRPLILTAAHCIDDPSQIESIVMVFGRQELVLGSGISGYEWRSDFGANLLSYSSELDFALLELDQTFPDELMCDYLGWDRHTSTINPTSSIHHPSFDYKEIVHSRSNTTIATFNGLSNGIQLGHWKVPKWTYGETVIGSSGASLLNSHLRVIGGLSGSTKKGIHVSDYFFRLDKAWDYHSEMGKQLKPYLDPLGLGVLSIEKLSFNELRDLTKVSKYEYADVLSSPFILDSEHSQLQDFDNLKSGEIAGIYLTLGNIDSDLLNTITISILSSDEVIHIEEVSLFKMDENEENYIQFLNRIPFQGSLQLVIDLNSNFNDEFVELPMAKGGLIENTLHSLHIYSVEFEQTEQGVDSNPLIFPNPAYKFALVNQEVVSVILYDARGYLLEPAIDINSFGQTYIELADVPSGVYFVKLITFDKSVIERLIIR